MTPKSIRLRGMLLAASAVCCSAFAQKSELKPGDRVQVTAKSTALVSDGKPVATLQQGQAAIVSVVQGAWIGCEVETGGRKVRGWVLRTALSDRPEPAKTPADAPPENAEPEGQARPATMGDFYGDWSGAETYDGKRLNFTLAYKPGDVFVSTTMRTPGAATLFSGNRPADTLSTEGGKLFFKLNEWQLSHINATYEVTAVGKNRMILTRVKGEGPKKWTLNRRAGTS